MSQSDWVQKTADGSSFPPCPNLFQAALSMYFFILGDWDLNNFTVTTHYYLAPLLFVIFTFVMMVVFFNLLIAIMSETYARVKLNEEQEFLKSRAETICDLEKQIWRPIPYPKWIHAVIPTAGWHGDAFWGRKDEVSSTVTPTESVTVESQSGQAAACLAAALSKHAEILGQTMRNQEAITTRMTTIEEKLDLLLKNMGELAS